MPQSRHRKIVRARKRPKGYTPIKEVATTTTGRNDFNANTLAIVLVALAVLVGGYFIYTRAGGGGAEVTLPSGLKYVETAAGTGPGAQLGQTLSVKYTGKLQSGKVFDSSDLHGGKPYDFVMGRNSVIKGWEEGMKDMKVGAKRTLTIPPALGYGAAGSPPNIPPNATLVFDVELVSLK